MSLATVLSRAVDGLSSPQVSVEVHISAGLPAFALVGLPDTEVKEARDRVRSAIINSGFEFPSSKIIVNLAPADFPKEGGRYDLPIAIGILAASGQIKKQHLSNYEFAGELSLSGDLRNISGALAMILNSEYLKNNKQGKTKTFILPSESANEAALALINAGETLQILAANSLNQVCNFLSGNQELTSPKIPEQFAFSEYPNLTDVLGQPQARRVLEIVAAGRHSLLMSGPPGSGKSMLASRLPSILPPMSINEAQSSAAILSLAGQFKIEQYAKRPFRSPHHTASAVALVGGGNPPRPGEISLAHEGILFLDELPEFPRKVLDTLREPLESKQIHIARAAKQSTFPAKFQLIAAMNPCPCGYLGDSEGRCRCTQDQIRRYTSHLSGPLLDRIDLFVEVPAVSAEVLATSKNGGEPSEVVQQRVCHARNLQMQRQGKTNADLEVAEINEFCQAQTEESALLLLTQASSKLGFSARSWHKIFKLARTIADLDNSQTIHLPHMAEAIQYRRLRSKLTNSMNKNK